LDKSMDENLLIAMFSYGFLSADFINWVNKLLFLICHNDYNFVSIYYYVDDSNTEFKSSMLNHVC
jgi:hypothetical protein